MKDSPKAKAVMNYLANSVGLTDNFIAGARRGKFDQSVLDKAPTYSTKELGSLDNANIAWKNLGLKIEMAFGHFNAKHGQQMVRDIGLMVDAVMKLADALIILSERFKIFEIVDEVFNGLTKTMRLMNGESVDAIQKGEKGKRHLGEGTWWMNLIQGAGDKYLDVKDKALQNDKIRGAANWYEERKAKDAAFLKPKVPAPLPDSASNVTNINQTITHHGDAKDTKAVKDSHKAAINHAYRQRSAQWQGA
jgi:tetrahydromethanopterin S-methyltransferase subunit G